MIPMIKIQSSKERFRFNLATDTICGLCKDNARCAGCAVTEIRKRTGQLSEKGLASMDCCSMRPPETDPALLERYGAALEIIRDSTGTLGLLSLPKEDKDLLKKTIRLEEKVPVLESIAARLPND